tara:strand:- start:987 stop:2054 length:1068 start_codon:yes stop_codon:yes gene_type:complete
MQLNFLKKNSKNVIDKVINSFSYEMSQVQVLDSLDVPKISRLNSDKIDLSSQVKISQDDIRNEFISRFTPSHILADILKNYIKNCVFKFRYNTHLITINYFYKESIDYNDIILLGIKSLVFCEQNGFKSNIRLLYIPHHDKKKLDSNNTIGPSSVNSGFTTFELNGDRTIVIFRKEEAEKLLIHELVHYLGLDYNNHYLDQIEINSKFMSDFDIVSNSNNINTFEAYTDFIAILYNNIYDSILNNDDLEKRLDNEIRFQKYQVHKILNKFDMIHPLKKLNNGNKISQSTNVVSYYILKLGIMSNYMETINRFTLGKSWSKNKIREFYNYAISKLENIGFNPAEKYSDLTMRMSYV